MSTTTHTVWRGNEKPANSKKMQLSIATLNATGSGFLEIMCDWVSHNMCDWAKRFRKPAYWYPLQVGYDRPVGEAVYAIDNFPDDDLFWRIEWIGGVGYNTSVPKRSPNGCVRFFSFREVRCS